MAVTVLTAHRRQWQGWIVLMLGALLATAGLAGNFNHDGDFDGDGVMDPAVYDEPSGEWHVLLSGGDYEPVSFVQGGPGWTAIQSDYDGDGRADIVLYNRTTGTWRFLYSHNDFLSSEYLYAFGGEGWVVGTGDYDGDGKTDPTIYCEATGEWKSMLSLLGYATLTFGGPGHTAVSGDYDGDGYSDPAVYRRSDGQWQIQFSLLGYATKTGYVDTKGDGPLVPSPADYDGDRKTDPAVFAYSAPSFEDLGKRYVCGWHLLSSRQNFSQIESSYFLGREGGESIAAPAPGDYDGDGKADFALVWPYFENAHVMWKNWRSSDFGVDYYFLVIQWTGTDVHPVQR